MKKSSIAFALLLCITLYGCEQPKNALASTSTPISSVINEGTKHSDEYYPHDGSDLYGNSFKWLHNGTILAVPHKNTIRYLNDENMLEYTAELPEDAGVSYVLYDDRIFVLGTKKAQGTENEMQIHLENGEYTLANCSLYDGKGKLIKDFPAYDDLQEELPKQWPQCALNAFFINDDNLIIQAKNAYLFMYTISTNKVVMLEDKSELVDTLLKTKGEQIAMFFGASYIGTNGKGAYYFVYDDLEYSNTAGKIYYADETGKKELFDGQRFSKACVNGSELLLINWITEEGKEQTTDVYIANEKDYALKKLELDPALYWNCTLVENGFFGITDGESQIFAYDIQKEELVGFTPMIAQGNQYEVLKINRNNTNIDIIYSAFLNAEKEYYLYNTATKTNTPLEISSLSGQFSAFSSNGRSYVQTRDENEATTSTNANDVCVGTIK